MGCVAAPIIEGLETALWSIRRETAGATLVVTAAWFTNIWTSGQPEPDAFVKFI